MFSCLLVCSLIVGEVALAAGVCSRVLRVPASNLGWSMAIQAGQFRGILPEFIQQLSVKSHCQFQFEEVPKNRQEILFASARSDLLLPAIRTEKRDKVGDFVSLAQLRPVLISYEGAHISVAKSSELIARTDLKLVVVRAFDYGIEYQNIIRAMEKAGRLLREPDPISVVRLMGQNHHYVTIMAATIFYGVLERDARATSLKGKWRYEVMDEFPWMDSGIYVSRLSLPVSDRRYLKEQIEQLARSDLVWKLYLNYYPAEVLKVGMRPLVSP